MFKLAIVGTVAAAAAAKFHPINQEIVNEIKAKATTWVPYEVSENPLRHHTPESLEGLLGDSGIPFDIPNETYADQEILYYLPEEYDTRKIMKDCVHPIRDQQRCGSCWAFGSSEALSDRFCFASNKTVNIVLSPEHLVSCDHANFGCNGGWIGDAF